MKQVHQLIKAAQDLDATSLDNLICALAQIRANKQPPVSSSRPRFDEDSATAAPVTFEDLPAMFAKPLQDGRFRLWMRSSGFGWLAFNLEVGDARVLRDWFNANVTGFSDLFGQEDSQRH
jgi:hypothetical protein